MEQRIGEYLVRRMLGEGGMGKVYEAEERLSGRRVALKVLRPELARSDDGRRLFLSEMQILAHLEHPGVVRSLASFEHEGQLVLVLEYLEGHTLRDELLRRERIGWIEAVEIACRIAEALDAAHRQEPAIIHRDLKPENVMLTPGSGSGGGLKVMDFGIAKVLAAAQATNTQSLGTLQYMSPEQIDARPVDARTDLYALGLVLYEMLSGKAPFVSSSPRELLNLQCTADPPALPEDVRRSLPRGVDALWRALLAKRPEDRPETARDVLERLAPFRSAEDAPLGAAPANASEIEAKGPSTMRMDGAPPVPAPTGIGASARAEPKSLGTAAPRADTIALLERNTSARDISTSKAIVFIVGISLFAGIATYLARSHAVSARPDPATSAAIPLSTR
jgi:serine/threonine-protein kinase